jgi:hypothetical protein
MLITSPSARTVAEQHWFDAGEIRPRDLAPNPRCQNCQTGGMKHPGRRCGISVDGDECECESQPGKRVSEFGLTSRRHTVTMIRNGYSCT